MYVGLSFGYTGWVGYGIHEEVRFKEGTFWVKFLNFLRW